MGMSWRAIIAALGTAAGLVRSAKNLRETVADLGETRRAPSPPFAEQGHESAAALEELRARLERLEANEARQAELIAKMADQDQALWNQLQHLAARVDKIFWIALVALIFSSVPILRELIRLFF
jgi:predicted nuclease with TOPRIM domain